MAHILIVTPTFLELSAIPSRNVTGRKVQSEATGVGVAHTLHALHTLCSQVEYHWIIQCGLAGAIDPALAIGDAIIVKSDTWGDMGVWEHGVFRSVFDMSLAKAHQFPYKRGVLQNAHYLSVPHSTKAVTAITCNQISTDSKTILWHRQQGKQIETMEGAAFHFFCLQRNIKFIQLRAISNEIGERNKKNWNIPKALKSITHELTKLLKEL